MSCIDRFTGPYEFLSNFYDHPFPMGGVVFPTAEHAFQAQKARWKGEDFERIRAANTPNQAKRLGRSVPLRDDWEQLKVPIMRLVLRHKFHQGGTLAKKLLETGDAELIEGNTWGDVFWGQCKGVGENWLGRLLMEVREELRVVHFK